MRALEARTVAGTRVCYSSKQRKPPSPPPNTQFLTLFPLHHLCPHALSIRYGCPGRQKREASRKQSAPPKGCLEMASARQRHGCGTHSSTDGARTFPNTFPVSRHREQVCRQHRLCLDYSYSSHTQKAGIWPILWMRKHAQQCQNHKLAELGLESIIHTEMPLTLGMTGPGQRP